MSSVNKPYWRSVEDLTGTTEFREWMHREFPDGASEQVTENERRNFLKVMGASFALAGLGLTGCRRWPETKIVPAASQAANRVPGDPVFYSTAWEFAGFAQPLLAKSFDGRPIKLETNSAHPWGGSGVSSVAQAQILALYDPQRSRTVLSRGHASTDPAFVSYLNNKSAALRGQAGKGLAILTQNHSGPSYADLIARVKSAFPQSQIVTWEPLSRDNAVNGSVVAFSSACRALPAFDKAQVIVSLGDDFLYGSPDAPRWARQWAAGRAVEAVDPKTQDIARLYVIENGLTTTGMNADERLAIRLCDLTLAAAIIAQGVAAGQGNPQLQATIDTVAKSPAAQALMAGRGKEVFAALIADLNSAKSHHVQSLVTAGATASPATHALVAAINDALGNAVGTAATINYIAESATPSAAPFAALVAAMRAGNVNTLIVLDGNPVYDAPVDLDFGGALAKVADVIHIGMYANETAMHPSCSWHIPQASFLESWGDARSFDGTLAIQQPLILPMVAADQGGRSHIELLAALVGSDPIDGYSIVRRTHVAASGLTGPLFESAWRGWLDQGYVPATTAAILAPQIDRTAIASALQSEHAALAPSNSNELVFLCDVKVWDGRFSELSWMQELPDPVTKITWDNVALMSLELAHTIGVRRGDMVKLAVDGRSVAAAAWPVPGYSQSSVGLSLGYGRTGAGVAATALDAGFNAYKLRSSSRPDWAPAVSIEKTGEKYEIAHTQDHGAVDALDPKVPHEGVQERLPTLIREATVGEYRNHPDFARHVTHVASRLSLWSEVNLDGAEFRWAMSIDLSKCTGCSACVTACQAENNIPVVGKDQVLRGREMHWIRIDRYFRGANPAAPESFAIQPVTCMHCENAPCEQVCPVAATVHDKDGLNSMVYNRCIGTRYCSNNCPYKVRRFNFFDYQRRELQREEGFVKVKPEYYVESGPDVWLRMQFNPDVTVRMRGVMEKCTFCTQRIQAAKIKYKNAWAKAGGTKSGSANFSIPDGSIVTACQQACPTAAITFGDLNVTDSKVAKLHRSGRSYQMLEELNTKTRLQYLARVSNPATARESGGTGGHPDSHSQSHSNGHAKG
ncbi:MAG: 4Fe-4S dicluster domain-containing protein [Phycisphaerales bacterium]|nr:4Fe-4S dicluster domain-containing protein [Phycisphaerales bacterium]